MRAGRPYRRALADDEAVAELRRSAGTQFDPSVVDALCREVALNTPLAHADGKLRGRRST